MLRRMVCLHLCVIIYISIAYGTSTSDEKRPNIILMVMDDLGFNDVPWHQHTNTKMPFLQQFVSENALMIDTFYAMPLCSMTRSALLTGRYSMRYGLHSSVIENGHAFGLSVFESIIANDLQQNGYDTYMIGKWHLGFHRHDLTPLQRGFDEFRGSYSPMIHYFDYEYSVDSDLEDKSYSGFDLWINSKRISSTDTNAQYLTEWEGDQFIDILDGIVAKHDSNEDVAPFFMYVGMHASHDPREATDECLDLYYSTDCINREFEDLMNCEQHQIMQAQSSCADVTQQRMIEYLQSIDNGEIWSNTLLIWMSDNGAPPFDGDNSPLRGAKKELWEGGVRTPAFVSGGYLNKERYGQIFDDKTPFHVTDWYPTILSIAGITATSKALDGFNQWDAIQNGVISEQISGDKREFLYNVDPKDCNVRMCGAYRFGRYKFIWTQNSAPNQMYWYDFYAMNPRKNEDGSLNKQHSNHLECDNIPDDIQTSNEYDEYGTLIGSLPCGDKACLFDIVNDPCEYYDLSQHTKYANLYLFMYNMLLAYYESQQLSLRDYYAAVDAKSDPSLNNGYWSSWMRNYNHDDDITDFEDVMKEYYAYDASQDVTLSIYYTMAIEYKAIWNEEQLNDLTTSNSKNLKRFEMLVIITVIVGIVILIGFTLLFIKWSTSCCQEREETKYADMSVFSGFDLNRTIVDKMSIHSLDDEQTALLSSD